MIKKYKCIEYQIETLPEKFIEGDFLPNLSAKEFSRYKSIQDPLIKKQFLFSRHILKKNLSEKTRTPPKKIEFQSSEKGRPFLNNSPWNFSISHSEFYCAYVVSPAEVGIDIQMHKKIQNIDGLMKKVFHMNEINWLAKQDLTQKENFFLIWTLKEAYTKCLGLGFQAHFQNLDFSELLNKKSPAQYLGHTFLWGVMDKLSYSICYKD